MGISVKMLLFVAGVGILQAIFLSSLIYFHPKSDRSVNKFLALYIFWLSVPMFTSVVGHFFTWQYLILMDPFPLLAGPLLYLYVRSFKEAITWQKAWPHFVLFVLYVIIDSRLFSLWIEQYPPGKIVPVEILHQPTSVLRVAVRMGQMIVYAFLARRALRTYQRSISQLFSETSKVDLRWVRWLINGFLILVLLLLGFYLLALQNPEQVKFIILINTAALTPYLYIVTFKGATQPTLWQVQPGVHKEQIQEELLEVEQLEVASVAVEEKDEKNALPAEKLNDIVAKTLAVMNHERLYLQSELTLQNIADHLKIPAYQVSQAINEGLNKTFYDLVNGYRVEEAKRLLRDPKSKNNKILAIAFDSGFNSKTTFNTVFKKFTGFTPSEFKERHVKELVGV
jgi:AraC-like DNA-binding protein